MTENHMICIRFKTAEEKETFKKQAQAIKDYYVDRKFSTNTLIKVLMNNHYKHVQKELNKLIKEIEEFEKELQQ